MRHESLFDINSMLQLEPALEAILAQLRLNVTGYYATTARTLPSMFDQEYENMPLLLIGSKRINDAWVEGQCLLGAHLSIDGSDSPWHASTYLTWAGPDFSLGIDTDELTEIFTVGRREGGVFLVWVTDAFMTLTSVRPDEDFIDYISAANQCREISRFVPDQAYFDWLSSEFPVLLSSDERRFVGADGNPVYVAVSCDSGFAEETRHTFPNCISQTWCL
jgi:hypothetical protein